MACQEYNRMSLRLGEQHFNCIAERILGRQQKMKESEKNLVAEWPGAASGQIYGLKCKIVG